MRLIDPREQHRARMAQYVSRDDDQFDLRAPQRRRDGHLSPAQLAVIRLKATGLTNKEVGHEIGISEQTVKNHVTAILATLGADSTIAAIHKLGWFTPSHDANRIDRLRAQIAELRQECALLMADIGRLDTAAGEAAPAELPTPRAERRPRIHTHSFRGKLTAEQRSEIEDALRAGQRVKDLAARYPVTPQRLYQIAAVVRAA